MNPEQSIIFHLGYLAKIINRRANALFHNAGYNIRIEQVPVLMTLCYHGRLSQQELADILGRDKSSVQRTIVTLSRNGLVTIGNDRLDKRKNIIALTKCGEQLSSEVERNMTEVEDLLFDHISDSGRLRLINMINELDNYSLVQ